MRCVNLFRALGKTMSYFIQKLLLALLPSESSEWLFLRKQTEKQFQNQTLHTALVRYVNLLDKSIDVVITRFIQLSFLFTLFITNIFE